MNDAMEILFALLAGYFFGSFPTSVIASRIVAGVDVRHVGTGNAGAANVFREIDPRAGVIVAIVDIMKAFIPVIVVDRVFDLGPMAATAAAVGALWGHQFSLWLKFRGGAGLASAVGGVAGLLLGPIGAAACIGLPILLLTRNMGWTGGITLASTLMLAAASTLTGVQMPAIIAVDDVAYLYGGVLIALLLALPFWLRLLFALRAARAEDGAPDASSTTENQK